MGIAPKGVLWYLQTRGLRISCAADVEFLPVNCDGNLFQCLGVELGERVVFHCETDFNGMATNFAVFDVGLAWDGCVQDHGDFFTAVRALECVFHD
jgi:hypothetical protein